LRPNRACAVVVGVFALCCAYFSGFFPPFSSPNELSRFQTVVAFVESGTFSIDAELGTLGDHEDKAEAGGRFYSNKAPGLSLAAIPVYRALRLFLPRPISPTSGVLALLRFLTVSLVCILALARFSRRLRRRKEWESIAPLVTFAVAFGTPFLFYARSFFSHAWCASLLFLAWDALSPSPERASSPGARALAGLLAGWAAISEYTVAPVALALAARAILGARRAPHPAPLASGEREWNRGIRALFPFAAGAAIPLALLLVYQKVCFGSPFVLSSAREAYPAYSELARQGFFGFGPPSFRVAAAYLFHPARGILVLSPFFLWAGVGFARSLRSRRESPDGTVAAAATLASFILLTGYANWHGGWALGSRYLLPLLFFVAAALPFALETPLSRGLFAAAAVFSAATHVLATSSWPHFPLDFGFPPVNASAWFLAHGWVAPNLGIEAGLSPTASLALPVTAAAAAVAAALSVARPIRPSPLVAFAAGVAPLVLLLHVPVLPPMPYSGRLLRATIYGNYSGLDPRREELRGEVGAARTPLERAQADRAWKTAGPGE
jgi:hypothetical protein